ncbi:FISUMP domain-containing protein [Methanohalobium sp.]|uniref:FISUMP domain-containing protein n=1 Tax=Methanohalobium sp. TaxID=2837493 RepID=UPI0025EDA36E|nr:FISUMP domain-containing protein [Methanohalobium sp.]
MKTLKFYFIFVIGLALFFTQSCEKDEEDQETATAPIAAFTANQTSITVGSSIDFTDQSKNSPTDWNWDFGDGNTSNSQNPSHTYNESGTYTVSLTVTNNAGSDTETKTGYITVEESSNGNETGTFTDSRDGQTYEWIKIGDQVWMAENLNYDQDSYGKDWCYDNDESNCNTYGRLYDWAAVMQDASSSNSNPSDVQGVCPDGWHVPSDEEWKELEIQLGMSQSDADNTGYRGSNESSKLAGIDSLWKDGDLTNNSGFGSSGFTALPGGYRNYGVTFSGNGKAAYWWSSSEDSSTSALGRILLYNGSNVYRDGSNKESGFSVRCVRDD